jgi:hypothetical protein
MKIETGPGVSLLARLLRRVQAEHSLPQELVSLPREDATAVVVITRALGYQLGPGIAGLWGALTRLAASGGLSARAFLEAGPSKAWEVLESSGAPRVGDPHVRSRLLYDIAYKVDRLYSSSFYSIVVESKGLLFHRGSGFVERLEDLTAYRSPARSKPLRAALDLFLLGIFPVHDAWNARVPVDSGLVGLALRSCAVMVDEELLETIASGVPLEAEVDAALRWATLKAFDEASSTAGLNSFEAYPRLKALERLCSPSSPELSGECTEACRASGLCEESRCLVEECCASVKPLLRVPPPRPPLGAWWD